MAALIYLGLFTYCFFIIMCRFTRKRIYTFGRVIISEKIVDSLNIIIAILPIILFLGLRVNVGTDYKNYLIVFHDYTEWGYANDELGLLGLFEIAQMCNMGYQGFLFLAAMLSAGASVFAIRRLLTAYGDEKYFPIAVLIYLLIYFGPLCNIMAQMVALTFEILAFEQILNKKLFRFLLICTVGLLFHTSFIVIVPLYFVYNYLNKKQTTIIAWICLALASVISFFPGVLAGAMQNSFLQAYVGYIFGEHINTFLFFLIYRIPLYFVELLMHPEETEDNRFFKFLIILEIAACIVGIRINWGGRLVYYFSIAHVFYDIKLINSCETNKEKLIRISVFVIYYIAAFIMMHFYSGFDGIASIQFA